MGISKFVNRHGYRIWYYSSVVLSGGVAGYCGVESNWLGLAGWALYAIALICFNNFLIRHRTLIRYLASVYNFFAESVARAVKRGDKSVEIRIDIDPIEGWTARDVASIKERGENADGNADVNKE